MLLAATVGGLVCAFGVGCSAGTGSAGAGDDGGPPDASVESGLPCLSCFDGSIDAPLAVRVRGVMDQICGSVDGCHGAGAGNMGILIGSEFVNVVGVTSSENPPMKRVAPGDPDHSYVMLKLACDGGIIDACMPLGDSPQPALVSLFRAWIEAGAPTQ